jgi:hypothetical protein
MRIKNIFRRKLAIFLIKNCFRSHLEKVAKNERKVGSSRLTLFITQLFITQRWKIQQDHRDDNKNADNDEGDLEDFFVFWIEKHGNYRCK